MHRSLMALPLALALVASAPAQPDNELKMIWQQDKTTQESAMRLKSVAGDKTFIGGCGNKLDVNGTSISIDVDDHGVGTLDVGDNSYRVIGDRKSSGGTSCTKMYNDEEDIIECTVPWPHDTSKIDTLNDADTKSCFSEHSLVRRQGGFGGGLCNGGGEDKTELKDGDGYPEQDVLHRQASHSQDCADKGTCYVAIGNEETITFEASFGGNKGWFSGGFSVSKSRSDSEERGCYGDAGDTVCQWVAADHTRYQMTSTTYSGCGGQKKDVNDFSITSPNEGSSAVRFYCVINNCRSKGDQYWENSS